MKKIYLIIFSILAIFINLEFIKAECDDEELNEWAVDAKIEAANSIFDTNTSKNIKAEDLGYSYFLVLKNPRDDVYMKAYDGNGTSATASYFEKNGEKYNIYGIGCYTNLKEEKYKIEIYGAKNSACPNELIATREYVSGAYNDHAKSEYCEENQNSELCNMFDTEVSKMTDEEFNKAAKEETKEPEKEKTVLDFIREYGIFIVVPFLIITLVYVIKVNNYKKNGKKE